MIILLSLNALCVAKNKILKNISHTKGANSSEQQKKTNIWWNVFISRESRFLRRSSPYKCCRESTGLRAPRNSPTSAPVVRWGGQGTPWLRWGPDSTPLAYLRKHMTERRRLGVLIVNFTVPSCSLQSCRGPNDCSASISSCSGSTWTDLNRGRG